MLVKVVCVGLIILILFALISVVPENLNQRKRGEKPTFSMEQMILIVAGGIAGIGTLATIATEGQRGKNE